MSYILEALKKSERDRAVGGVPTLSTEQTAQPRSRTRSPWLLGGAMVIVGLSFGLVLSRFGDRAASRVSGHQAVRHAAIRARTAMPSVAPVRSASVTPLPDAAGVPMQQPASRVAAQPRHLAAKAGRGAPGGTVGPLPVATSPVSQRPAVPAPPQAAVSPAAVFPAPSPPVKGSADLPLLQDLPADFRQGLPTLHVDVHVYDKDPTRRFVLINMQRYRQGDRLASGPRVLRITRSGVVLEYRGVRFRLGSD